MERACWLVPLQGAAAGCCCRVPPRGAASVRFGACLLMLLQGVAAGCPCRVLQGAAIRVVCALWSCPVAGCCCRAPLQGAAVRVVYALWSWPAGAAIGCCCRCCQSAVCLVVVQGRLGCCFRAARCAWQCGVLGLDGDYVYAVITSRLRLRSVKRQSAWLLPKNKMSFAIWGLCWRKFDRIHISDKAAATRTLDCS